MNGTEVSGAPSVKRRTWLIAVPAILIVLLAAFMVWDNLYGASAKQRAEERADREQTERYREYVRNYEDAMRADTYGGSTPEETLQLFITALKAGDIDLASKYFSLETDENSPDYLTHEAWKNALQEAKEQGNLPLTINMLEKAKPAGSAMNGYFGFEVRSESNELMGDIGLRLNEKSNVWKIQSM